MGLAFEVDEGLATHIDGDAVDSAARESVGGLSRVVVSDRFAALPSDEEAGTGDRKGPELGPIKAQIELLNS